MTQPPTPNLCITPDLCLPEDTDARRLAFVGMSGSGKTSGAKVVVERLMQASRRVCIIDPQGVWHGLKTAADGKSEGMPFIVFGGRHGDVPLEATAGAAVADLVMEEHLPVILDLSGFEDDEDMGRVCADFLRRLRHLQNADREPLLLVVDEADLVAPQNATKAQMGSQRALINIARRSRSDGLGLMFITQRPVAIHKDILTQSEAVFLMRFAGYNDLKTVEEWLGSYLTLEQRKEVVATLPKLKDGEAFVTSPSWMRTFQHLRFPLPQTYDSSATPKAGGARPRLEARAAMDMTALAARFSAAIEREQENDPAVLKARITQLEGQLREPSALPVPAEPRVIERIVNVPVLAQEHVETLMEAARQIGEMLRLGELGRKLKTTSKEPLQDSLQAPDLPTKAPNVGTSAKHADAVGMSPQLQKTPVSDIRPAPIVKSDISPATEKSVLPKPQQRVLNTLAELQALGLLTPQRSHVALFAGQSPTSSAFGNNLGALRTEGLIDYPAPGLITLTATGQSRAVPGPQLPTRAALHAAWIKRLPGPEGRMLAELIEAWPNRVERKHLAEKLGRSITSSTFGNNMGALRSLGLADYPNPNSIAATKLLFPDGLD